MMRGAALHNDNGPAFAGPSSHPAPRMVRRDTGSRHVLRFRSYFTPCISLLTSGATRNSSTPEPTSAQKPKV